MAANQPVRHRMERARPGKPDFLLDFTDDALRAPRHLERRAAGEGEEEDPFRRNPFENQMSNPVRERIGLAGARPRDDEQRLASGLRRLALPGVEPFECRRSSRGTNMNTTVHTQHYLLPLAAPTRG